MKKLLALMTALIFSLSLAACGSAAEDEATDTDSVASGDEIVVDEGPRYTSDGELIEEEELPASDSSLSE